MVPRIVYVNDLFLLCPLRSSSEALLRSPISKQVSIYVGRTKAINAAASKQMNGLHLRRLESVGLP